MWVSSRSGSATGASWAARGRGARESGRARRESDRGAGDGRGLRRRGCAHRAAPRSLTLAYLKLDRLVKSYDGRVNAVDGISLEIDKGEFLTLLGPSGSGK